MGGSGGGGGGGLKADLTLLILVTRWTAIGWPHKIERQMEQTSIQLDEDEERFRKLQMSDQANFEDKLDTLQVGVFASVLARGMGRGKPHHL